MKLYKILIYTYITPSDIADKELIERAYMPCTNIDND